MATFHTFSPTESLVLSELKIGDKVYNEKEEATVTNITAKNFAIDDGRSNQNPLEWTKFSHISQTISGYLDQLELLQAEEEMAKRELSKMEHDSSLTRVVKRNTYNAIVQRENEITLELRRFQWNIADGKTKIEGGADDDDLAIFIDGVGSDAKQCKGSTNREKFGNWLIKKKEERPPTACVIS